MGFVLWYMHVYVFFVLRMFQTCWYVSLGKIAGGPWALTVCLMPAVFMPIEALK